MISELCSYLVYTPSHNIITEVSLIATSERPEDGTHATPRSTSDRKVPKEIISIPVDLKITVKIITPTAEADTKELYYETQNIYQNFDPSKTTLLTDAQEEEVYLTRNQLYAKVRKGRQNEGLDLQKPVMAYQPLVENTQQRQSGAFYHTVRFGSTEVSNSGLQTISQAYREPERTDATVTSPVQEYSYIGHVKTARQQVPPFYEDLDNIQARVNSLKEKQKTEQRRIERIQSQLLQANASLTSKNSSIEDDITRVKEGIAKISRLSKENSSSGLQLRSNMVQYNRQVLIRMTEEQVCES